MDFIEFLDNRFADTDELRRVNKYGISSGFDGFKEFAELEFLYSKFKNDIDILIEETGVIKEQLMDDNDNERTSIMKLVWLATSIYCLSRVDSAQNN